MRAKGTKAPADSEALDRRACFAGAVRGRASGWEIGTKIRYSFRCLSNQAMALAQASLADSGR